jgi:glycosyltransferase involved in cell wall biosynthesis
VYVVAGQTHPRVLEREGERYRRSLESTARKLGLAGDVVFTDRYLSAAQLHRLVRSADVVLLPYDSREQVTSGVLIEAVAAGKPVVSTRFPHAVELLEGGAGLLVDQGDPLAIADALRRVLTEPGKAARMSGRAEALAPELSWRSVAGRYLAAGSGLPGRSVLALTGQGTDQRDDRSVAVVA